MISDHHWIGPLNHFFFWINRSMAHIKTEEFGEAVEDAEESIYPA